MVGVIETPAAPVEDAAPAMSKSVPLRRVKRLERPNKAAFDETLGKLHGEMDGLQNRVREIKAVLDKKQQSRGIMSTELVEARGRLVELKAAFRGELDAKKGLRDQLNAMDRERDRKRSEARSLRENLQYSRVEQIDEEMKKLEYRHTHTSLTLQEEKKVLQQMKDLAKMRDVVKDYTEKVEKSSQDDGSRSILVEQIKEKDKLLNSLKAEEQQQVKVVAEIKEKEAAQAINVPALIEERNTAYERIKVLRDEVKNLRTEFRTKEDEFWEREREWREQQAVERKRAFEKREAERSEREQYRKQKELENFVEPYTDEIILCDQLFHYLQKYAPSNEEAALSTATSKVEIQAPKGVGNVILSKKSRNDEELDGWFAGSGAKSKGKKANGSAALKNREKEKISLSLDALTSFGKVKISPPTTVGDVTKCVEEVKVKKEHFVKLQSEDREAREKKKNEAESKPAPAAAPEPETVEVADTTEPDVMQEEVALENNSVAEEVKAEAEPEAHARAEDILPKDDLLN